VASRLFPFESFFESFFVRLLGFLVAMVFSFPRAMRGQRCYIGKFPATVESRFL
jgi:hypothetical protein